jgi:hypothetical protein
MLLLLQLLLPQLLLPQLLPLLFSVLLLLPPPPLLFSLFLGPTGLLPSLAHARALFLLSVAGCIEDIDNGEDYASHSRNY